jgi:hypothetical protein
VLDLLAAVRHVAQNAANPAISDQTIYTRRRQELIDTGRLPGTTSAGKRRAHRCAFGRS